MTPCNSSFFSFFLTSQKWQDFASTPLQYFKLVLRFVGSFKFNDWHNDEPALSTCPYDGPQAICYI